MTLLAIDPSSVKAIARHIPGTMNRTEAAYAAHLEQLILAGDVVSYIFECVRLVIGTKRCTYMPDFMVILPTGVIEFHEVKGYFRDDARVKIKAAAKQFHWFAFKAATRQSKKRGGGWDIEEF